MKILPVNQNIKFGSPAPLTFEDRYLYQEHYPIYLSQEVGSADEFIRKCKEQNKKDIDASTRMDVRRLNVDFLRENYAKIQDKIDELSDDELAENSLSKAQEKYKNDLLTAEEKKNEIYSQYVMANREYTKLENNPDRHIRKNFHELMGKKVGEVMQQYRALTQQSIKPL